MVASEDRNTSRSVAGRPETQMPTGPHGNGRGYCLAQQLLLHRNVVPGKSETLQSWWGGGGE